MHTAPNRVIILGRTALAQTLIERIHVAAPSIKVRWLESRAGQADLGACDLQGRDLLMIASLDHVPDLSCLPPGLLVTEVTAVKMHALQSLASLCPAHVALLPSSPLFLNAMIPCEQAEPLCVLTPTPDTALKDIERLSAFWQACGARIEILQPEQHDAWLSIAGHIPSLLQRALMHTLHDEDDSLNRAILALALGAPAPADVVFTPDDIDALLLNKNNVINDLETVIHHLAALRKSLRRGDRHFIQQALLPQTSLPPND